MRVAIVGAGAIGGFIAAALAKSGVSVAVIARGAHLDAILRSGLHVESDLGEFRVEIEAADTLRDLGRFDLALLTFKAHQWPGLLDELRPLAGTSTTLVTMQNGLPFWFVREPPLQSVDPGGTIGRLFADSQIVGSVVHVSGSVVAPGRIRQSGGLRYVFGDPGGGGGPRANEIVELFRRTGLAAEADPDIRRTVWLKLVNNVGLNAVSALERRTIHEMLADPATRARVRALMIEALSVGQALGVVDDVDVDQRLEYAARLNDVKTSMLQDLERGRAMEIDPILGAVAELAVRCGVAVPRVDAAYAELTRLSKNASPA